MLSIPGLKLVLYGVLSTMCSLSLCNSQEDVDSGSQEVVPTPCNRKRPDDISIRILFVGNSLTYTNNLPKLVENIGRSKGKSIYTKTLAYPNYAIEDHWKDGTMPKLICEGDFDFVVIQQGPSSQSDGRSMLIDYGQRIKDICSSRGTALAFFMVWPAKSNYDTFESVIKNYTDAARVTNSILCAVGLQFKEYGDRGDYRFYSSDNFHPSSEGSQMAAEIIYSTLIK